jgi:hypothetical protein
MSKTVKAVVARQGETRAARRAGLEAALTALPDLRAAFSELDPYAPDFAAGQAAMLARETAAYWPALRALLPELDEELALRNAWAVALARPLWTAVLYRSVQAAARAPLHTLADQLLKMNWVFVAADPLACAIAQPETLPPDLLHAQALMPGMRLRYALAHRLLGGDDVPEMVLAAQQAPGATVYVRRRELQRMVRAAAALGLPLRAWRPRAFLLRPVPEQALVLSSDALAQALLPRALARHPALADWVEARTRERDHARSAATQALKALAARDFPRAEEALREVPVNGLTRLVCRQVVAESGDALAAAPPEETAELADPAAAGTGQIAVPAQAARGNLGRRTWQPLGEGARRQLRALLPAVALPPLWQLDAKAVARALIERSLPAKALAPLERRLLGLAWDEADHRALIDGDLPELVPAAAGVWVRLLPEQICAYRHRRDDAGELLQRRMAAGMTADDMLQLLARQPSPWLLARICRVAGEPQAPTSFSAQVFRHVGTPVWQQAGGWDLHGHMAGALMRGFVCNERNAPVDPPGFAAAVAAWLVAATALPEGRGRRLGPKAAAARKEHFATAAALAARFPEVLERLVPKVPAGWLEELIPEVDSLRALAALLRLGPASLAPTLLQARARLARSPQDRLDLLVEMARARLPTPWREEWLAEVREPRAADDADGHLHLTVLVLALRRDAKRLRRLAGDVDPLRARTALTHAARLLRGTPGRDSAFLELAARLGLAEMPMLAAALAACRHDAPAGRRVDEAYTRWALPKRSGGVRTISAPSPSLKRVQRAILRHLLDPLGAHPCAHGFAKGRSILGNARVHVGREIVVNGDVSNCFPSVRWPLVLGALRRDLGGELSAGAISLLVDLCTAEGGLPTGAPTSPALLNRVLLRTDEILQEQARRRECLYSRYADDLTFSGDHRAVEMLGVARGVLSRIGLSLDPRKTNIFRQGRRQMCTGLVVNEQVSVPRRVRRRLRAAVHQASQGRGSHWHGQPQSSGSLKGRLAFLGMVHPEEADRLARRLREAKDAGQAFAEDHGPGDEA